ncbi:alpha-ketoacid dehydrogenase subunit beta [Persephonella sp.]
MLYREALNKALDEMMEKDETVVVLGIDVGFYGGTYRVTEGLYAKYGEKRVIDTPIVENSIVGNAIGMAIGGLRPVAELMTVNFSLIAMDQIVNQAAKLRYMSGGKVALPMVVRTPQGVAKQLAAQHSQSFERFFSSVPGLKVFVATDAVSAYYGLKHAISIDDPVVFLEHELLYPEKMEFKEVDQFSPYLPRLMKEGKGITVVSYLKMFHDTMRALPVVEKELNTTCEVFDLVSLNPVDIEPVVESIKKTGRFVIVTEEPKTGSYAAEFMAKITEEAFYYLDAPPLRICGEDVPTPYNRKLELASIPTPEKIAQKIVQWGKEHGI